MQRHSNPLRGEKIPWVSSKQGLQYLVNRPLHKQEAHWNMTLTGLKVSCCYSTPHFSSGYLGALHKRWQHPLLCFQRSTQQMKHNLHCKQLKSTRAFSEDGNLHLVKFVLQWIIMAKAIVHYENVKNNSSFYSNLLHSQIKKVLFFLNTVHGISPQLH